MYLISAYALYLHSQFNDYETWGYKNGCHDRGRDSYILLF